MNSTWLRRHRLAVYYVLALAIAMAVMAVSVIWPNAPDVIGGLRAFMQRERQTASLVSIIGFAVREQPLAWLIVVFAAAPTLSALMVSVALGGGELARLLRRLRPWQAPEHLAPALRFYGLWFTLSGLVMAWYYWQGSRHGTAEALAFREAALGGSPVVIAAGLFLGPFLDEGGTLEELGWRGFGLPVLLERLGSPLRASVVLGTIWMLWHLPREIPGLLAGVPLVPFLKGQGAFLVLTVSLSVLSTYGFLETGGSVIPAVVIHGGSNVWSKALAAPLYPAVSWAVEPRTAIITLLAIAVVVTKQWRWTAEPRTPGEAPPQAARF